MAPSNLSWADKVSFVIGYAMEHDLDTKNPDEVYKVEKIIHNGTYMRKILMPAGHIIFGREHIPGHTLLVQSGEVYLFQNDGLYHMPAGTQISTHPGFRWVGFTPVDTVVISFAPNVEGKSIEELDDVYVKTPQQTMLEAHTIYNQHKLLEKN